MSVVIWVSVVGKDIEDIVAGLSEDERTVLTQVPRVRKSKKNIFHDKLLKQKKPCWDIDVRSVLQDLSNNELMNPVNISRGLWQTTALGRKVAHFLEKRKFEQEYDYRIIRR